MPKANIFKSINKKKETDLPAVSFYQALMQSQAERYR